VPIFSKMGSTCSTRKRAMRCNVRSFGLEARPGGRRQREAANRSSGAAAASGGGPGTLPSHRGPLGPYDTLLVRANLRLGAGLNTR
jgi:hypothetical protein